MVGRAVGDSIAEWVARFNQDGLAAVEPRRSGAPPPLLYGPAERERILSEFRRPPDRKRDGTATWSLNTLQRALRRAPDGLPNVSTYTIWATLHDAVSVGNATAPGATTGAAMRKHGEVEVHDPDASAEKSLIEQAYTQGERMGLAVWGMDEAGPYQAIPQPGIRWQPVGQPARYPHEHIRHGTAKMLTLFHPATGQVCVKGVRSCP